jgi:hypothetical protein
MKQTRRNFLIIAGVAPVALISLRSAAAPSKACYDPAALSLSQQNSRRSVDFLEVSPDPKRRCGLCAFFTPGDEPCGRCQLFEMMPVTSGSVCNSFAAKSGA